MQPTAALRETLRRKVGESIPEGGSAADTMLSETAVDAILTNASDMNHAIIDAWESKLAAWSNLVDVTDGAASRKLGDLMEHAEAMIKYYRGVVAEGDSGPRSSRTRIGKIIRT